MLSPFRYPGGKSWLIPLFIQWASSRRRPPKLFAEPFAGGASVGLYAAENHLSEHVILVELEPSIAAVWNCVLKRPSPLIELIETFEPRIPSLEAWLKRDPQSQVELAFKTLLKNRVSRGGVIANGAGILRDGERGKGVFSRWYPETIISRIRRVHRQRRKITFLVGDGLCAMEALASERSCFAFIDPPYSSHWAGPGKRLYLHNSVDHEELFRTASRMMGNLLMTYNSTESVRRLSMEHGFRFAVAKMRTAHHRQKKELLIAKDLSWLN